MHSYVDRAREVVCYLLLIIGASCSEDVPILSSDHSFWLGLCGCMLAIDLMWLARYAHVMWRHAEAVARAAARQRFGLLLVGTLLYAAASLAAFHLVPVQTEAGMYVVPALLIAAACAPVLCEHALFVLT